MQLNEASCFQFTGKSMETETTTLIRISQRREGHCRTNTTVRRKIYVQKSMTISKDWLIERKSSMLDEIESKTVHIDEEGDR